MEALMEAEEAQGGGTDWGFGEPRRTGCSHYNEDALIDRINWEEHLIDRMMPSIPDILGDIPLKASFASTFDSIEGYMEYLLSGLFQDVVEQLKTPLGCLDCASYSEIININEIKCPYYMVDIKLDIAGRTQNHFRRPFQRGDVILLSMALENNTITSHGICLAMAAQDEDQNVHAAFKVRIMEQSVMATHYKYVVDLDFNIQSSICSWLSAHAEISNKCKCIINSMIQIPCVVGGPCSSCINSFDTSQFKNDLDEYQLKVIESITHSLSCKHSEYIIELIRGAQDSGKTNLLSTLLASIGHRLKCVVYVPSACDVVNLLNEMKHLSMPHHEYKQLCEKIIVFERTSDLGAQLEQMSMDSQVNLATRFMGTPGWRYFINWTIQVLKDYKQLYNAFSKARKASFLDIFKDEFMKAAKHLKDCMTYLYTRVRNSTVEDYIMSLLDCLEKMEGLLGHANLDNNCLMDMMFKENLDVSSGNYAISAEVNNRRIQCIEMLKNLKKRLVSLGLQTFETQADVENYCINTATIMFCSADSSCYLREKVHSQIDCLIIDDANLLNENETIVPLCLPALTSIVLAGDDTPYSQECQEDRIGPSLFERLRHLGFKEHLLLKQYKHKSHSWQHERKAPEKPKPPREFSWVGRTVNTKHVLAPVRDQGNKDICALMSTIATTESLYKYSYASQNPPENFNIVLDVQDMFKKYKEECGHYLGEEPEGQGLRGLKRVDTALKVLKNHGVIGTYESDDHWKEEISLPITISSFKILERDDTAKVCRHLHDGRFLVGSMKMSYNFFEMSSGDIYHFDPQRPIINSKNGRPWLHAVMILGYGEPVKEALMEHKHKTCLTAVQTNQPEQVDIIGHLVYQNSHGALFGLSGGYGRVGWESIVSLWLVSI